MADEDDLDITVFRSLITQVAFETMDKFSARFKHISSNSRFSADFSNLEDLEFRNGKSTL